MPLYSFKEIKPNLGPGTFIAESADLIGKITCGKDCSFWYNTVVRGDVNEIKIGDNVNVQDLSMLHVIDALPLIIGDNVSIGHNVTLHACTIEDSCLIGMGAIVLDGAVIGRNSLVAAGSVVPPGKVYPPNSFIVGSPAVVKRELNEREIEGYGNHYKSYIVTKDNFINDVKLIK